MSQLFASGVCVKLLSRVRLFAIPWTVARQAPLSMDSPGKNTGVGCHFPAPGDLPDPGIKPTSLPSPGLAGGFFTTSTTWEAQELLELKGCC